MINITLPDGSIQEYDAEVSGYEIAENIGPRLLSDSIAIEIEDKLYDLSHMIKQDSIVRIITKNGLIIKELRLSLELHKFRHESL